MSSPPAMEMTGDQMAPAGVAESRSFITPAVRSRVTTNFLPKFENAQGDGLACRISRGIESNTEDQNSRNENESSTGVKVLVVSKKHSGSLIMAPPFFAKNSTGNSYSRMAALLLKDHFGAVWGDQCGAKFNAWWAHAVRCGITYSFECVTPRILGDHGATPKAAYLVLTAVSVDSDFLSPTSVLQLATAWRLPLNEAWYVPWCEAEHVEDLLHQARWTASDSDIDKLMEGVKSAALQRFLRHTDTQGEVLEGFVFLALEISSNDSDAVARLCKEYSDTMEQYSTIALAKALDNGKRCLNEEASLAAELSEPIAGCPEPIPARIESGTDRIMAGEDTDHTPSSRIAAEAFWWGFACRDYGDPQLQRLFQVLRDHYGHVCKLKPYCLDEKILIQVHVGSDDVFYGWRLHMLHGAAPLFRGMVVTFSDTPLQPLVSVSRDRGDGVAFEDRTASKILEIAKLKCMKYIFRTFAVRNKLEKLLRNGPDSYVLPVHRNFCRNWHIPAIFHNGIKELLTKWADYVSKLDPASRANLERGHYLRILEPFLESIEQGKLPGINDTKPKLHDYSVIICDLTYEGLPESRWSSFVEGLVLDKKITPVTGTYKLLRVPPAPKHIFGGPPVIVIGFSPDFDSSDTFMPPPSIERKMSKMWEHVSSDRWRERFQGSALLIQNPVDETWPSILENLQPIKAKPRTSKRIVVVMALPPGGGKSTFFNELKKRHNIPIVSSDECRAANTDFNQILLKNLRSEGNAVIGYDKNVPNISGLSHLCRVLSPLRQECIDVKLTLVAPEYIDAAVCWDRVSSRSKGHIGLNIHENGEKAAQDLFKRIFLSESTKFLEVLKKPEWIYVTKTSAFWHTCIEDADGADGQSLDNPLGDLVDEIAGEECDKRSIDTASVAVDVELASDMVNISRGNWISLDLAGTNLHVTLVSPSEPRSVFAQFCKLAGRTGIGVELGSYHHTEAFDEQTNNKLSIGFWEVVALHGLKENELFQPQSLIYHVTDTASLDHRAAGFTKPKHAADAMKQLRGVDGAMFDWTFTTVDYKPIAKDGGTLLDKVIVAGTICTH